jgi:hypothetical protein
MSPAWLLVVLIAAPGQSAVAKDDAATQLATGAKRKQLLKIKDGQERRWELRLLPHPLYRYESTDPDVVDGALFAFVTSAGTDPEALLAIEARKPGPTDSPYCVHHPPMDQ